VSRLYRVVEKPSVFTDYINIVDHIERWTDDRPLAVRTVELIREYIKGMRDTPHRGTRRDDLRPGLRIVPFRKRTAIVFEIDETERTVAILRVFYGGQDYEAMMRDG
jgi:plasmid stabilization system protein ParE